MEGNGLDKLEAAVSALSSKHVELAAMVKHIGRKVNHKARAQNFRLARIEAEVNNIIHDQKSIVKEMDAMNKNMKQLYHEPEYQSDAKDVASHNKFEGNGRKSDSEEPVAEHEHVGQEKKNELSVNGYHKKIKKGRLQTKINQS